jgi:hypothetical protein
MLWGEPQGPSRSSQGPPLRGFPDSEDTLTEGMDNAYWMHCDQLWMLSWNLTENTEVCGRHFQYYSKH